MQEIHALNKRIEDSQAAVVRLNKQIDKAEQAKRAAEVGDFGLSGLMVRKREILVSSHIDGSKPDTTEVDAAIAKAEKLKVSKQNEAVAHEQAIEILTASVARAKSEIDAAESEKRDIAAAFLLSEYQAAEKTYFEAVSALRDPVERMVSAMRAWEVVMSGRAFPRRGAKVLKDIRETGVRVSWEYSALRNQDVAALYTDNYRDAWYVPEWADRRNRSFGDQGMGALIETLRAAGFDVTKPMAEESETEPQVEIEVVLGTIQAGREGAKIDPVTGALVNGKSVCHGPGSRVMFLESEAARFVKSGIARYAADVDAERAEQARKRMEEMTTGSGRITVHQHEHA